MHGFVQIPIVVIILLIAGVVTLYSVTQENSSLKNSTDKVNEATPSAKVATSSSEVATKTVTLSPPKSNTKPNPSPAINKLATRPTPVITGLVLRAADNKPLKGYFVFVNRIESDGSIKGAMSNMTDENGNYIFENVAPGAYRFVIGSNATASGDSLVTVKAGDKILQGITIKTSATDMYESYQNHSSQPTSNTSSNNAQSSVKLDSISPNPTKYGDTITIKGSGFGSSSKTFGVIFNNSQGSNTWAGIISWSDTEIKATVPPAKGEVRVQIESSGGEKSNVFNLTVNANQPYLNSISPANVKPGGELTLGSDDFGNDKGSIKFYQNGNSSSLSGEGSISSWSNTQIKVNIPGNLTPGQDYGVQVVTADGRQSSYKYYTLGN